MKTWGWIALHWGKWFTLLLILLALAAAWFFDVALLDAWRALTGA